MPKQSINDIFLHNELLANLYAHHLVELAPDPQPLRAAKSGIKYLGNHSRQVTIMVYDPVHTFLPEHHLAFLTKILGACLLNTGDVAIVNTFHSNIGEALSELNPKTVINFGSAADEAPTNEFEITAQKGITWLNASTLEALTSDSPESKVLKGKLWSSLKQLFGIS